MKLDLTKIKIAHSELSDKVYLGTISKDSKRWVEKIDITQQFIHAAISKWEGHKEIITDGEKCWEISVKKVKKK